MGDDQIVISSGQVITPESVMSRSFSSAFRGYHPAEVRQFLKRVSDEMAAGAEREVELRRALQDALARAAHPELDEATLTNLLGEHAAKLLASARETAATIVGEARQQADAVLRDAEARVARMREEADGLMARRVAEADASAASIQRAAEAECEGQIERATKQGKEMVAEARAVRERMLADLARRRRSAQVQIEQLRAVRERLVAAYDVVRRTVDEATAELDAAEPEARIAAEAIGRRAEEPDVALQEAWTPPRPSPEPERAGSLVGAAAPARAARESPAPATALLRRVDAPSPPERPRLRPQTVAGAVAERSPAPPAPEAAAPPPPTVEPAPVELPTPLDLSPTSPPVSELATSEVPIVTADGPPGNVEELFARIRADRLEPDPEPAPETEAEPAPVDPVVGENALEGRDDLLDNLEAGLTRALKRVLGDEQNEVLDALRRLGASAGAGVLPEPDAQIASFADAAVPWLQQAARAGIGFVSDPGSGSDGEKAYPSIDPQSRALARDLVDPLRERLFRALEGGADAGDPSVVAESLRATYRQWKVQQVEESARHHVLAAFNAGAFAATPEGAVLQWLVDDEGHCPDCDDNALAGPTAKGQPFPTGQLHPPAHPGCRCLLVPVTA
jgi:DivIVA domain-containing protein